MKALVCHDHGLPESLSYQDWHALAPKPGEVRVALHAAGVNYPDILQVGGKYQFKSPLPFVFGAEGAGEVVDCGEGVEDFKPGDRVIVQAMGCWAEQITVPVGSVIKLAGAIDMVTAAAFPVAYHTAWHALIQRGHLHAGETLLVHGASGGVGLAAVQIGKHLGATVIATGGSDAKLAMVKKMGADHVINHQTQPMRELLRDLTAGAGPDVVFDPVGGSLLETSLKSIAPFGRILVIGFTSGTVAQIPSNLLLLRESSVIGVNIGMWAKRNPVQGMRNLDDIQTLIAAGKLTPHIARTFDLAEGAAALNAINNREVIGKYVLLTELGKANLSSIQAVPFL